MSRHTLFLCLLLAVFAGVVATPAAGGQCAAAAALLQQPKKAQDGELNPDTKHNTDKPNLFSDPRTSLGTDEGLKPSKSQAVLTTTRSQGPSSHDLLTTLSLVVLVNNLMPRPLPARWALATTGAAWLWLAFKRLQPWLPQTSPPSRATTASTPAAGADAVAAAAGLSAPATAAGAVGGVGGDPSTRWWQFVLLFMELLMGNAVDAILLMGLLLLPVIALRRWWRGKTMWGSMSVEPTTTAGAATAAAPATEPASDTTSTSLVPNLARSSIDGLSTQLHSAGQTAARLAKAMHKIGSQAVRRGSFDSTSSRTSSSSGDDGSSRSSSSGSSADTSSTGSMVSPGQSVLQPATPPLLFVARPAGPSATSGRTARHNHQLHKPLHRAADDTGSPSQAATAAAEATHSSRPSSTHHPKPKQAKETRATATSSSTGANRSGSSDDVITAVGGVRVQPGDSSDARQMPAAAPAGSHTDSGSNVPSGVGLNLGALGTIRTSSARGPAPPMYPTRALYSSPLETVVISCKLGSNSSTTLQARGTAAYVTSATPTAAAGPSSPTRVEVPLSPVQASLATAGHGSSISAQRDLRAVIEAAVRQAVAASNISVLSTSVTSFPGCVHVVATAHLTAAAAGTDGGSAAVTTADVSTQGAKVAWQQVVQQVLAAQGPAAVAAAAPAATVSSGTDAGGILSREGLYLKHLLVQDAAGNIHYLWVSPEAAAAAGDSRSGEEGSLVSVQSGKVSPQPSSPSSASSSSSSSSCQDSSIGSIYSRLAAAASTIGLSSFTLPNDTAADDVAPAAASKLLLPAELAEALSAANAGLRVVLSANPAAPSLTSDLGTAIHASSLGSASLTNTQSPSSVVSNIEGPTSTQHLLIDHTLWPGTSSWPTGGGVDLLQLLPQGTTAPQLAQQFGPVLTLNLVASSSKGNTATAVQAAATADAAASPTAADEGSMSELQLSTLSAAAAATSSSSTAADAMDSFLGAGAPDTAAVRDHEVTRTPSAAQQLHSEITSLLNRLQANKAAETAPASTEPPAEATPALPLAMADVRGPESRSAHQQDLQLGEYLLLQLPLLLLPSAACQELRRLQERMAGDIPADVHANTAGSKHMLPLINDIAAALNIAHSSSRALLPGAGCGARPTATAEPSAPPPAAAPAGFSPVAGLQPQTRTAAAPDSPQPLSEAGTSDAGTPKLTGVRALIAQREQMAAAAAASVAASPRAATLSPRASAVSPRALPGTVPSPRAHASPARSLSWSRSPSPALSPTSSFRPLMAGRPSSPANQPAAAASAQTGDAATSHSTQQSSDKAGLVSESASSTSSSSALQPMTAAGLQAQTQEVQQVQVVVLTVEQKQLLKSLLQYMSDQGLEVMSAAVSSYIGINDIKQLVPQPFQQVQHTRSSAGAGPTAAGFSEIEPAEDKDSGSRPSTAGPSAAASAPLQDVAGSAGIDDAEAAKPHIGHPTGSKISSTGIEKDGCTLSSSSSVPSSAAPAIGSGKDTAKVLQQASAAHEQAMAAHRAAAATESALQLALQQISALSAAAAQASRQAAEAQVAAAAATERAAAVEERAERERALHLISSPAGAAASGTRGIGIWGLLSSSTRAVAAARASGSSLLGGVMSAAESPVVPEDVTPRDVLLGFKDERLEVQYRRWKALQCRSIDRAAFLMQLFRQVVYVWRIGRLMYVSAGTGLSLVLLCKYEAVVLLPYVVSEEVGTTDRGDAQ